MESAALLTDLLGSKVQWVWGAAKQAAFDTLKQALCTAPVLLMPDLRGNLIVDTDASHCSIGGIILQDAGKGLQPVAYYSKKLIGAPANYPIRNPLHNKGIANEATMKEKANKLSA